MNSLRHGERGAIGRGQSGLLGMTECWDPEIRLYVRDYHPPSAPAATAAARRAITARDLDPPASDSERSLE